jgi:hypothetical protein
MTTPLPLLRSSKRFLQRLDSQISRSLLQSRKPFTPTLGLAVTPFKYPYFEGTASLYYRLGKSDTRIAILTCAHVARTPPIYKNSGLTQKNQSQPREYVIALGRQGYKNAVEAMVAMIGSLKMKIEIWNDVIYRLGEPTAGSCGRRAGFGHFFSTQPDPTDKTQNPVLGPGHPS